MGAVTWMQRAAKRYNDNDDEINNIQGGCLMNIQVTFSRFITLCLTVAGRMSDLIAGRLSLRSCQKLSYVYGRYISGTPRYHHINSTCYRKARICIDISIAAHKVHRVSMQLECLSYRFELNDVERT